ncbi:hypothetical protein [Burkholderia cepacia]|uniref:hypothetical protein n=1 Tax=Burkholderia cepacia TaxID=292 RepID=UPI00158971DE|nr:hypothetical protein [Burkholderia cepacia]
MKNPLARVPAFAVGKRIHGEAASIFKPLLPRAIDPERRRKPVSKTLRIDVARCAPTCPGSSLRFADATSRNPSKHLVREAAFDLSTVNMTPPRRGGRPVCATHHADGRI